MQPSLDDVYPYLWLAYEDTGFAEAVTVPEPRPPVLLSDIARELGIGTGSVVLDAGCGQGNHAHALAENCGALVVGLDPVEACLKQDRSRPGQQGATAKLAPAVRSATLLQAWMDSMPFADQAFDLIWSRTVLVHVRRLAESVAECARVLQPGGVMVVETSVASGRMEPREAAQLYRPLSIRAQNMSRRRLEKAFRRAGFEIHACVSMGGEALEYFEAHGGRCSKTLLRLAAMRRAPREFIASLGRVRYEIALAAHEWVIYHLLGKLETIVYSLRKPAPGGRPASAFRAPRARGGRWLDQNRGRRA